MRIVVHGQQAFGKAVLEALLKRGENVIAVYVAPEKPGQKADPLKEAAQAARPSDPPAESYRKPEVWEQFRGLKPDLQVMAFVTLFVPEDFLNIPTNGSIQYHPSLLPKYRGPSAINWPIIQGDTETGLSIFWPDNGLDTGDVLLQKKTPISRTTRWARSISTACSRWASRRCSNSVDLVKAGKAPRIKQDQAKATYEGRCGPDNAHIDWGRPWRQIHNLIRGCNPAPGAWTNFNGKKLQIFDSKPLPARDPKGIGGKMGEVVAVDADGFTVVCADGRIRVMRVKPADGPKAGAGEFAAAANLARGHTAHLIVIRPPQLQEKYQMPAPAKKAQTASSQHANPKSDIEISQAAKKRPIIDIARERLGIAPENLDPYGHYKAKLSMDFVKSLQDKPNGKLILVSAITPTPAGEGKTTTTVGLTDALNHIGKKAMLCLREPSLGPSFGMKGGAAGGGYAQVVPMEDINLHFTGDFHAITSANNLLAAMVDNHIYWGNALGIDQRRVVWRRVHRHERPRAALDRLLARRRRQRLPARGRVRHHGRLGDHGDLLPRQGPRRPQGAARQHRRRLYARPQAGARRDLKAHGAMTALLKERGHRAVRLEVAGAHRLAVARIGDDDIGEPRFEVVDSWRGRRSP